MIGLSSRLLSQRSQDVSDAEVDMPTSGEVRTVCNIEENVLALQADISHKFTNKRDLRSVVAKLEQGKMDPLLLLLELGSSFPQHLRKFHCFCQWWGGVILAKSLIVQLHQTSSALTFRKFWIAF